MKSKTVSSIAIALLLMGFSGGLSNSRAIASTQPLTDGPGKLIERTIRASPAEAALATALITAFPTHIDLNISETPQLPTTLVLAQPLTNAAGEIIAPINSPIQATLVATDGGVTIQVEAVVVGGQMLPIKAISSMIPVTETVEATKGQQAGRGASIWGRRGLAAGCLIGRCSSKNQMTVSAIGAIAGSFEKDSSDKAEIVRISEGSVFILPIQTQ